MIKLSEMVIMISAQDGTMTEFEPDELQNRIIRSFLIAGNDEVWAAEDIVMAVEYALLATGEEEKIFSQAEVDAMVTKVLHDSGFSDVAEAFDSNRHQMQITIQPEPDCLKTLLAHNIGLSDKKLEEVIERIITASRQLNIATAAPELFVELGKYYKDHLLHSPIPRLDNLRQPNEKSWSSISSKMINHQLQPLSHKFIDRNVIKISGIRALFPTFTISLNLAELARHCNLYPPVTELMLLPGFNQLAVVINDIAEQTERLFRQHEASTDRTLHLCITVTAMEQFATQWLEARWPDCRKCCHEMMIMFSDMLQIKPYKITFG